MRRGWERVKKKERHQGLGSKVKLQWGTSANTVMISSLAKSAGVLTANTDKACINRKVEN